MKNKTVFLLLGLKIDGNFDTISSLSTQKRSRGSIIMAWHEEQCWGQLFPVALNRRPGEQIENIFR